MSALEINKSPGADRDLQVGRVLLVVLGLNLVVALGKGLVAYRLGSVALAADTVHSALDGLSNVVGLVGIRLAAAPPDVHHPYGHRRFETLAALVIAGLMAAGLFGILQGVFHSLTNDTGLVRQPSLPAALFVAATVLVNIGISTYESRRGKELSSALLAADAAHTASDAFAALLVLLSFGAALLGMSWVDPIVALLIAFIIGRTTWSILRTNLGVLLDQVRLDSDRVREVALSVEGVEAAHRIRSRGPADHVSVDLCVHLDPELSLAKAHDLTHEVARALEASFPEICDVVIHTEPADHQHDEMSLP